MKKIALALAAMLFPLMLSAQREIPRPEEMNEEEFVRMQTTDMAEWLHLENDVRKKFIDTYSAFRIEINSIAKKSRPSEDPDTEDEIERAMLMNFEISEQILETRKRYYSEFRTFLAPSQIRQMYRFENEAGRRMQGGPDHPEGPHKPKEHNNHGHDQFRMGPPPQF